MRLQVILNEQAGGLVAGNGSTTVAGITRALEGAGHSVDCVLVPPGKLDGTLALALGEKPDAILVGGGDGSIRSAAQRLAGTGTPLGVIPLGTLNRMARDLGLPLEPVAAAEALARGTIAQIDVGEINGRPFVCNAMLGLSVRFTSTRQSLRGKPVAERLSGYAAAFRELLEARRRFGLEIDDGTQRRGFRALSVVVSVNAYAEEPSLMMRRESLDGGELAAYVSLHSSGWELARGIAKALLGRVGDDAGVTVLKAPSFTLGLSKPTVPVSIDGEIERLEPPLEVRIRPRALGVLRPPPEA